MDMPLNTSSMQHPHLLYNNFTGSATQLGPSANIPPIPLGTAGNPPPPPAQQQYVKDLRSAASLEMRALVEEAKEGIK